MPSSRSVSSIIDTIDHALEWAGDLSCDAMRWSPEPEPAPKPEYDPEHDADWARLAWPAGASRPGGPVTTVDMDPPRREPVTILQFLRHYQACPPHQREHARWVVSPEAFASLATMDGGGLGRLWRVGRGQEWEYVAADGRAYLLGLPLEVDPGLPGRMAFLLTAEPTTSVTYAVHPVSDPPATMR